MHVPVYIVCAALVIAVNSEESAYYRNENEPIVGLSSDEEALGYFLPKLMSKYRPNRQWANVAVAPYYPIDIDTNTIEQMDYSPEGRIKRAGRLPGPSLSISNSLDVLRNRLLLEISRKNTLEGLHRNRNILCKIGKRARFDSKRNCDDSEKFIDDKLIE